MQREDGEHERQLSTMLVPSSRPYRRLQRWWPFQTISRLALRTKPGTWTSASVNASMVVGGSSEMTSSVSANANAASVNVSVRVVLRLRSLKSSESRGIVPVCNARAGNAAAPSAAVSCGFRWREGSPCGCDRRRLRAWCGYRSILGIPGRSARSRS